MVSEVHRKAKNAEKQRRWANNHPEKHYALVKKWEQENPEHAREIHRKARKKYRLRLRQEAIALLGGRCVQCQCDDIRCLQIDHIIPLNGGQRILSETFYKRIIQGQTENLQVLCANCHAIKTYYEEEGQC